MNIVKKTISRLHRQISSKAKLQKSGPTMTDITRLFRNVPQLQLLSKLIVSRHPENVDICIHGVADGSEAVSILVMLDPDRHNFNIHIDGHDIRPDYIEQAKRSIYSAAHFTDEALPDDIRLDAYLEPTSGESWALRKQWQSNISYSCGDVTASAQTNHRYYDLVMCRNVLVSLTAEQRQAAIRNMASTVRPGGLLAVGGGPLGEIPTLIIKHNFMPVMNDVELIHESWKVQRQFFNNPSPPYWALEPFNDDNPEGPLRYCTIFRKRTEAGR